VAPFAALARFQVAAFPRVMVCSPERRALPLPALDRLGHLDALSSENAETGTEQSALIEHGA
jgi:hypothetical protein